MYRTDKQFMTNPATAGSRVYIGGLAKTIVAADLEEKFKLHGKILGLVLQMGFAFIQFENELQAQTAIKNESNTILHGRKITVKQALDKSQKGTSNPNNNQMQNRRPGFGPQQQPPQRPLQQLAQRPPLQHQQQQHNEPRNEPQQPLQFQKQVDEPIKPAQDPEQENDMQEHHPPMNHPPMGPNPSQKGPPSMGPNPSQKGPPPISPNTLQKGPPPMGLNNQQKGPSPMGPNALQKGSPMGSNALQKGSSPMGSNALQKGPPPMGPNTLQKGPPPMGPNTLQKGPPPMGPNIQQKGPPPMIDDLSKNDGPPEKRSRKRRVRSRDRFQPANDRYRDESYYGRDDYAPSPYSRPPVTPVIEQQPDRNDCEIIVVSKPLTKYAEYVEQRLKALGLIVDLLFPNEDVPIGRVLANISSRGCLYAILIMPQNEEHRSLTLNILHGLAQEHRNMPIEDALVLMTRNFDAYMRGDKTAAETLGPGGVLSVSDRHPTSMQLLLNLLAENRQITSSQYDKLVKYLQERREVQHQHEIDEGVDQESQESNTKQAELQSRIMNILNKAATDNPPPPPETSQPSEVAPPLLKDPSVQKALDSLLGGEMFKNISAAI